MILLRWFGLQRAYLPSYARVTTLVDERALLTEICAKTVLVWAQYLWHNFAKIMAKGNNATDSDTITVTVSVQSKTLLDQLAEKGIYGRNRAEVAGRFIDQALQGFMDRPKLKLETKKNPRKR